MTSEQFSLFPEGGDEGCAPLSRLELAACGDGKVGNGVGAVIRKGMSLEPGPQGFDRIELGRIRRQEGPFDSPRQAVDGVPYQAGAMGLEAIPNDQQASSDLFDQRLEEGDDLRPFDRSLVQAEVDIGGADSGDHRQLFPVEVELDHRRLSPGRPGPHTGGPLRQPRFVDEDDYAAFPLGFFLSKGQVRFFQSATACSLRSMARLSGFWLEKPSAPRRRQTWTSL